MTSISQMQARCPDCQEDLRPYVGELTVGDSEDIMDLDCPQCGIPLTVELVAMFEVLKNEGSM